MAEVKLDAETRNEFGKGAARRIRRADKIPAVLYGHGTDPIHITLPGHETQMALRQPNVLLSLTIDGKEQLALPKQVQRDPIKRTIEHVDLLLVKRGEKVTVEVPVVVIGDVPSDATLIQDLNEIQVEAPSTNIPGDIEINVGELKIGDHVTLADVKLPEGATAVGDPETLVLSVSHASAADLGESPEAGEGETGEGADAASGGSAE